MRKITKCASCGYLNIVGLRKCPLCGEKCYLWSDGLHFKILSGDMKQLIIMRNSNVYANYYLKMQNKLELIPYVKMPFFVTISTFKLMKKHKTPSDPDGTNTFLEYPVREYHLNDNTGLFVDRSHIHESKFVEDTSHLTHTFNSLQLVQLRVLEVIFSRLVLHKISELHLSRIKQKGQLTTKETEEKRKVFLDKFKRHILLRHFKGKYLIYLKPRILGHLEFIKLNNMVTDEEYLFAFKNIMHINNIHTRVLLAEENIKKGTEELYEKSIKWFEGAMKC